MHKLKKSPVTFGIFNGIVFFSVGVAKYQSLLGADSRKELWNIFLDLNEILECEKMPGRAIDFQDKAELGIHQASIMGKWWVCTGTPPEFYNFFHRM